MTFLALLLPSSANERIRNLLTVVNAVSALEKIAENNNKIIRKAICVATDGSKISSPNCYKYRDTKTVFEYCCFLLIKKVYINSYFT